MRLPDRLRSVREKLARGGSPALRRSAKNAAYNSLDQVLQPVLWILAAPFFVARLGVDQYGLWMLVNTVITLSGVTGLGLGDATIKYVAKYRALDDPAGVARVVRATATVYVLLGVAAGTAVFLAAPFLAHSMFKVGAGNAALAVTALRVGGVGIAVRSLDVVFQSAIQGFERYDIAARISMAANTATIAGGLAAVVLGQGLTAVLWASVAVTALSGVAKAVALRAGLLPGLSFRPTFNREALREVFEFGVYSWAQGVAGLLLGQVDRLLIASLLGTTALGYYSLCLQLAQQIHALLSRATAFLFPLASAASERGETERLRRFYFLGAGATTAAGTALAFPIFMLAHNILRLWMSPAFADQSAGVLRVLAFVFALLATSIVPYYYMNGTGYVRLNTAFGLVSGVIVAGAALVLIPPFGIVGAAWARIANTPASVISRTILHHRVLHDRRWHAGVSVMVPVVLTFAAGAAVLGAVSEPALAAPRLVLAGVLLSAVSAALSLVLFRLVAEPRASAAARVLSA